MTRLQTILIAALAMILCASSGWAAVKKKPPLTVKLVYSTGYDDNILKYSCRDLASFRNNQENYLPPNTTADDWTNSVGLRLYKTFSLGRRFSFRPYYSGKLTLYAVNPVKNQQSHNLQARFSYRNMAYLTLKYIYLPNYFLRVYYDKDTQGDRGADFNLSRLALSLRLNRRPFEMELEGGREYNYYNPYFTEFDVQADFLGATVTYLGLPFLDASIGYTFKNADNVGFQQGSDLMVIDPNFDTQYGNGSYDEDQYSLNLGYQLPRIWKDIYWKATLDMRRHYRYYQSESSAVQDPFHSLRRDRRDVIAPSLTVAPTSDFEMQLSFTYDLRRTRSPNPTVPAIKNYDNRVIEFTFIYQVF
jgi:hypothetical protein